MILIIDCGSSKTPFIEEIVDEFIDAKIIGIQDFSIDLLTNIKGIIISGAPILITEVSTDTYTDKMNWIKTSSIPILGICFGHQLIGLVYGALPSKMKEDRDWQTIEVYENCALFNRLPMELEMIEDHCETISIPAGFQLVASSDACINECMQHKEKPIFGVQFHPEVSGNHGRILIENFIQLALV